MDDAQPIATVEKGVEVPILLFCPDQGGWHTAVWFEGQWTGFGTLKLELKPTHWLPVPPDPEDWSVLSLIRSGRTVS